MLTEPKNALAKQYQRLFAMENADLQFTDEALHAIARKAQEKDTGARGLRSIIEEVMLDIMFDLPERGPGNRYMIAEDVVEGREAEADDRRAQEQKRVTFKPASLHRLVGPSSSRSIKKARDAHGRVPGFLCFYARLV